MAPITFHEKVGVGLRAPHLEHFSSHDTPVQWLEIHSENYFQPYSASRHTLRKLRETYPISCHGIGLSLGSADKVNVEHLNQLKALINEVDPLFVSDHLSWSQTGGHYFNDLLPLPYTEEALSCFCLNVLAVQDAIQRPILIENPSSYLSFEHSVIPEWEFLAEVQARTDCRLLLDLNNVYVSSFNHQFDPSVYLSSIPHQAVDEIHLAGFTVKQLEQGEIWIDTHSQPVCDQVWQLYQDWISSYGPVHTLIEWDVDIPEVEVLLQQAELASDRLYALEPVTKHSRRAS
ncbi:DUF692 domain-containing protein [Vibrio sp. S4M6]|uniref:MNIO family bufferin maturase n=1 Tax=Vibrio sinus TaxID=2946865 RepID=UPI00202A7721|nr:DUF692 domain-containing protein [Vibrio sinus]